MTTTNEPRKDWRYNPLTKRGEHYYCKTFKFEPGNEIPVIVAGAVCEHRYTLFNGDVVKKGPCLILLRRGFNVAALPGLWTVIAGVDDIMREQKGGRRLTKSLAKRITVYNEVQDEIGLRPNQIRSIREVGRHKQEDPAKKGLVFSQTIFLVKVRPAISHLTLCFEHTGKVFIPIRVLKDYLEKRETADRELLQVLKDGVTPDFHNTLTLLMHWL